MGERKYKQAWRFCRCLGHSASSHSRRTPPLQSSIFVSGLRRPSNVSSGGPAASPQLPRSLIEDPLATLIAHSWNAAPHHRWAYNCQWLPAPPNPT